VEKDGRSIIWITGKGGKITCEEGVSTIPVRLYHFRDGKKKEGKKALLIGLLLNLGGKRPLGGAIEGKESKTRTVLPFGD